ncbi:hypothetical protein OCH239_20790 [Roseivivax halodurans JCM 10272]|uniref:Surface lipoprotein assembly modifier C-terminal domain-containing protein n=1 Tax=Roseivivax halodurans JCM 10272 TaxID=1449350 RepID=X7EIE9_9RHOB|nr:surface lipoprotein assembly modifier [Roseivivax halodurans]ETX14893.1 hypothetical protein OCH239_20790 [Roseivivax halodurans JCM 10272]
MRRGAGLFFRLCAKGGCLLRGAALAVALPWTGPAEAETLTPDQMRVMAARAWAAGELEMSLGLADALLARDAGDVQALLIRSRAARDLGRYGDAREAGLAAWRGATDDGDRYAAALAVAQALASDGARTRAQFWLRRAVEVAPSPSHEARAVRDFRYVRARNPWSTRLSFSVSPSSNINDGSSEDEVPISLGGSVPGGFQPVFVLGPSAKALSGIEYSAGLSTSRRLAETARRKTTLDFGLTHRTYTLSEESRDDAPDVEGSDFALSAVRIGVGHDWRTEDGRTELSFGTSAERNWYGGDPLSQTWRASAGVRQAITPTLMGRAGITRDLEEGLGSRADAQGWRGSAGLVHILGSGHQVSGALAYRDQSSEDGNLDFDETELTLGFGFARPIWGAGLSLALSAAGRHHDEISLLENGRDDRRYTARATVTLDEIDYLGFVPDVTLRATRNDSTLGLYDREEFGVAFGIRSKF